MWSQLINSCVIIILSGTFTSNIFSQDILQHTETGNDEKGSYTPEVVKQGFNFTVLLNDHGLMGYWAPKKRGLVGCAYPRESPYEHIQSLGLAVGAIIDTGATWFKRVTTSDVIVRLIGSDTASGETYPIDPDHPFYHTSIYFPNEPNRRYIDDDRDGVVDEDHLDGFDNDGDGLIDEDYAAVSESDYYLDYSDTATVPGLGDHHPLGIKVSQRSYAWGKSFRKPILPFDFVVTNIGTLHLKKVYLGLTIQPAVGGFDISMYNKNICGYWPELMTSHTANPVDSAVSPIGFTLLSIPEQLDKSNISYIWEYSAIGRPPSYLYCETSDSCNYNSLAGLDQPQQWHQLRPDPTGPDFTHYLLRFSIGPVEEFAPGDTLKFSFAIVSGTTLRYGPDNLYENAQFAQTLYARNYFPPVTLPAPKLQITEGSNMVHLSWGNIDSDNDPRLYWDAQNRLAERYPDDHWRRRTPPHNITTGGRIFEGFKLYRSDDPGGTSESFTLIRQWDVVDSVGPQYEYDVGIETIYTDSVLVIGKNYWYSLTSIGIPDYQVVTYPNWDGTIQCESLFTKSLETSVLGSRRKVKLTFAPSNELNKVSVVPNPYRVDQSYTFESGGWEGRQRSWTENKRLIKFIHLPPKCTIRVYSLAGDIVATVHHDDPVRGEVEWNLISESGRVIASGLYVYSVDSEYGTQIGKFVIIK